MKNNYFKEILAIRGMGQVISVTAYCVMSIVFGIINPSFFSGENTTNLPRQVVPIMIIGIGQSFVMITGGIDLSIGSVAGMSSMISATLMTKGGMDPWVASGVTLAACCLVGLVNWPAGFADQAAGLHRHARNDDHCAASPSLRTAI